MLENSGRKASLWWIVAIIAVAIASIGVGYGIGYAYLKKYIPSKSSGGHGPTQSPTSTMTPENPSLAQRYGKLVQKLIDSNTKGDLKDAFYDDLALFLDKFGPRYFGSKSLEESIDYLQKRLVNAGINRVFTEPVFGRAWQRGQESATVYQVGSVDHRMEILGVGGSPPTPDGGVEASAIVLKNLSEVMTADVEGKIVVLNPDWSDYSTLSAQTDLAAEMVANFSGAGVLVKSVTPFSVYSPHAAGEYLDGLKKIPAAIITVEDAEMLQRMQDRSGDLTIRITMTGGELRQVKSKNLIAEVIGQSKPDEIVLISAHIDSWDITYGALDDAAGVMLCVHAMEEIRKLKPCRTVRMVLWTGEEEGTVGSASYFKNHQHEKHVYALELDFGLFNPAGLTLATRTKNNEEFYSQFLALFHGINATDHGFNPYSVGQDIQPFIKNQGVPGATLMWKHERLAWNYYLTFHHTRGDRMPQIEKDDCRHSKAMFTASTFILADAVETSNVYDNEQKAFAESADLIFESHDNETSTYPEWYPFDLREVGTYHRADPWPSAGGNQSEFDSYNDTVSDIYDLIVNEKMRGEYFNRLATVSDLFGSRIIGGNGLAAATQFAVDTLNSDKLDKVHTEDASLPNWIREKEYARMTAPVSREITVLGLGSSAPTQQGGIEAEVLVVKSFEELTNKRSLVKGKIVVFAPLEWVNYGTMGRFRTQGADVARGYGAVAALVRSATPRGVYTTHGGVQFQGNGTHIPNLAITVADADMLRRISERNETVRIFLDVTSHMDTVPKVSQNIVAEVTGCEKPKEIVLISGHFDSWDVGRGSMDDGVGALLSWQTLRVLRTLNICPKRTIRMVMWTGEEIGGAGADIYYKHHENETTVFAAESDMGVFKPAGLFLYSNQTKTNRTMNRIKTILDRFGSVINATTLIPYPDSVGEDVIDWDNKGIPGMMPYHENFARMYEYYFSFHHSQADRMTVLKPNHLDLASYLWTVITYIIADSDEPFE